MSMTHPVDFASLRSHFPGATSSTYFDTASRGVPAEAKALIDEPIDYRIRGDIQKPKMFYIIDRVRNLYAGCSAFTA